MKFPFQHMHWVQHKRHNRKFNLKLIYWWNVIRSPTKTNKSTWHWEKDQLVGMKATNITIHRWEKSYTNWSTSAKPEWNAPSTTLHSKIKSFEVEMLMCANIYSFHEKKILNFWPWNLPWPNASVSTLAAPSAKTPSYKQGTEKREVAFLGCVGWTLLVPGSHVSSYYGKGDRNWVSPWLL